MLAIYTLKKSLCEVYVTLVEAIALREQKVLGEFLVRSVNARVRAFEAEIVSPNELGASGGVQALIDPTLNPVVLGLEKNLVEALIKNFRIQRDLSAGIDLILSIADEQQIAGYRASVDVQKIVENVKSTPEVVKKSRIILPPSYS